MEINNTDIYLMYLACIRGEVRSGNSTKESG